MSERWQDNCKWPRNGVDFGTKLGPDEKRASKGSSAGGFIKDGSIKKSVLKCLLKKKKKKEKRGRFEKKVIKSY